jgi:hypothetical protein
MTTKKTIKKRAPVATKGMSTFVLGAKYYGKHDAQSLVPLGGYDTLEEALAQWKKFSKKEGIEDLDVEIYKINFGANAKLSLPVHEIQNECNY